MEGGPVEQLGATRGEALTSEGGPVKQLGATRGEALTIEGGPGEQLGAMRGEAEREPGLAIAALGFPIVLLSLMLHGLGVYVVRQGFWLPDARGEAVWTLVVGTGVVSGLLLSFCGDLKKG